MLVFLVDDEPVILEGMNRTVSKIVPDADVRTFKRGSEALLDIRKDNLKPDIAFCDIEMPGMKGLELAVNIKTLSPQTRVVFVTGYSQYAVDAFKVRANGYLLKPVREKDVAEEIAMIRKNDVPVEEEKLTVRCFGHFDVYYRGEPVIFTRKDTKELLAYLVDREGAACTNEDIAGALWEETYDMEKCGQRIRNLINDLKSTLKDIGMDHCLIREHRKCAIRRDAIDCDYYRMLDGDMDALNSFYGEYMTDYSWAEITNAKLQLQSDRDAVMRDR